jgi:hypothetical protein
MKIQVLTFQRLETTIDVPDPWVAIALDMPWPVPVQWKRYYGNTPEAAKASLISDIRRWLAEHINPSITEVEITKG